MKRKNLKELVGKTREELESMVYTKKHEMARHQAELATGRSKNMRVVKNIRKDLAQIKTILQEIRLKGGKQ